MIEFINLTNGLRCLGRDPRHYVRIQSTWCEQKQWERVLTTLGADFYMALATGPVLVHDQSEKDRITRAVWQGLLWIRFACSASWGLMKGPTFTMRNGHDAVDYFWTQYHYLSAPAISMLRYYRQYLAVDVLVAEGCNCKWS